MKTYKLSLIPSILTVALFFTMLACGNENDDNDATALEANMLKLKTEIDAILNTQCAGSGEGTCKSIGFGAKACGGPLSYLIYSTSSTDEVALEKKVNEYNELNRKWNELTNAISDCMLQLPPKLECNNSNCAVSTAE